MSAPAFTLAAIGGARYLLRDGTAVAKLTDDADTDELLSLLNPPAPPPPPASKAKPPLQSWPSAGTWTRQLLDQWVTGDLTVAEAVRCAAIPNVSGLTATVAQARRAGYLQQVGTYKPPRGLPAAVYALTEAGLAARNERLAHEAEQAARANRPAAEHYAAGQPVATLSPDSATRLETP